jgi:hypothetical protein
MTKLLRPTGTALALVFALASVAAAQPIGQGATDKPSAWRTSLRAISSAPFPEKAQRVDERDPNGNGAALGALIGAGAAVGLAAVMYARCGDGCEAPSEGPTYLLAGGVGASAGAFVGWLVDKAHKGAPRRIAVAPVIAPREKSVRVAVRF